MAETNVSPLGLHQRFAIGQTLMKSQGRNVRLHHCLELFPILLKSFVSLKQIAADRNDFRRTKGERQISKLCPVFFFITFGEREREWERETEIQRSRERDRRKWRHHCRAKIGDEFTLSLAKNSHFSFLPSHFPSLPSRRGHHGGAEIRNEFTFPLPKIFSPSGFVPSLSNGTSRATSDRKPKTNDQILPSPILFFPSKKWIKLILKTIGNRKRDCKWGGSGW